jgi:hypothetical protein
MGYVLSIDEDGNLEWWMYKPQWEPGQEIPDDASDKPQKSLVWDTTTYTIHLVNDEDKPGPLKYYGVCNSETNDCNPDVPEGERGWHPIPGSGGGASVPQPHSLMHDDSAECGGFHTDVDGCLSADAGAFITSAGGKWTTVTPDGSCKFLGYDGDVGYKSIGTPKHVVLDSCKLQLYNDSAAPGGGDTRPVYYGTLKGGDDGWHKLMIDCGDGTPDHPPVDYCHTAVGGGSSDCTDSDGNPLSPGAPTPIDPKNPLDPCASGGTSICSDFPGWPFHSPYCDDIEGAEPGDPAADPTEWGKICDGCCGVIDKAVLGTDNNVFFGNCAEDCPCDNAKALKEKQGIVVSPCRTNDANDERKNVICKGCCVWQKVGDNKWKLLFGGCKRRAGIATLSCTCDLPGDGVAGPIATTPCKPAKCTGDGGAPGGGQDAGGNPINPNPGQTTKTPAGPLFGLLHVFIENDEMGNGRLYMRPRVAENAGVLPCVNSGMKSIQCTDNSGGAGCANEDDCKYYDWTNPDAAPTNNSQSSELFGGETNMVIYRTTCRYHALHPSFGDMRIYCLSGRVWQFVFTRANNDGGNVTKAHYYMMLLPTEIKEV